MKNSKQFVEKTKFFFNQTSEKIFKKTPINFLFQKNSWDTYQERCGTRLSSHIDPYRNNEVRQCLDRLNKFLGNIGRAEYPVEVQVGRTPNKFLFRTPKNQVSIDAKKKKETSETPIFFLALTKKKKSHESPKVVFYESDAKY